ncbi:hypothetical protein FNV43_RR18694 [Rhamnella rubrinervis]|uniref:Uncharacterized protein n=1 Tax=Rhamnella rubrinervis TaxID=2594499 RepID=A0A8K0GY41_9ROSA|nr:hypothetical protein FNV43_RR18694 [Rhamnella rubrinervis]
MLDEEKEEERAGDLRRFMKPRLKVLLLYSALFLLFVCSDEVGFVVHEPLEVNIVAPPAPEVEEKMATFEFALPVSEPKRIPVCRLMSLALVSFESFSNVKIG